MEELELKEGAIWIHESIKEDLQRIYDHYRAVTSRNEYLEKENERLKSEAYKDEELAKMKKEYEKMKADYLRGFSISEKEDKEIKEWEKKMIEKCPGNGGTIGGRFHYEFIPTGIGDIGTVFDSFTREKFTFRELR